MSPLRRYQTNANLKRPPTTTSEASDRPVREYVTNVAWPAKVSTRSAQRTR
jgi:hypothetical protein